MTDVIDQVRAHYGNAGLVERLRAVLGPEDRPLAPEQLAGLDQFHTRGLAATADLAALAGISAETAVLDVGSGVGGPARYIAATYGCRVIGVDLGEAFVEAARYLTARTGQSDRVAFHAASALDLPFEGATFDVVLLQHVAMNIAERAQLYRELRRVLVPRGRFATFDIVAGRGEPHFPLPWARTPETSFLWTRDATRAAIEQTGFRTLVDRDDAAAAAAWFAQLRTAGAPPGPGLGVVMGPDFGDLAANLGRSLAEGRIGVFTGVFEAA